MAGVRHADDVLMLETGGLGFAPIGTDRPAHYFLKQII